MSVRTPFQPIGDSVTISANAVSSTSAALTTPPGGTGGFSVRIRNAVAAVCYVKFGDSTVTATTSDTPMNASATEIFGVPPSATHVAVILSASSGSVYVTTGVGG